MQVIAKRNLMEAAKKHGDCISQAERWYRTARLASWQSLAEVKATYSDTDIVGDKTVFNIKGNHYRLIVHISYEKNAIYFKHLLTHAEYDKGKWKE